MSDAVENRRDPEQQEGRYELVVDGVTAFAEYRLEGKRIVFTHTEVPTVLGGRGVGTALVLGALDDARARGLDIVARCGFVAKVMGDQGISRA